MKTLYLLIFIFFVLSNVIAQSTENEIILPFSIFDSNHLAAIDYQLCSNDNAKHGVRLEKDDQGLDIIHWRWANKKNSWCGFGIKHFTVPGNDFSRYENEYSLELKIQGSWTNKAPQIKFMDDKNASSKLIRIQKFMKGDPRSIGGTIVAIPLKEFNMGWSIDIKNVIAFQFDAAYESDAGDVKIYFIKVVKNHN